MAIPTASGLTTSNLDQATDNPSHARSDIALVIQKVRELLESVDKAGGIVKLDADVQLEIARLFKTGAGLKLEKVRGQGNVLSHTNTPETAADVKAASGEAIKRIKIDTSGHVIRVEKGDVASLNGPFYSQWYYSRYEVVDSKNIGNQRPAKFNSDILAWIPGLDKKPPPVLDHLKALGAGKLLGGVVEEAMSNISGVRVGFSEGAFGNRTYYESTIKPYRMRFVHYTVK